MLFEATGNEISNNTFDSNNNGIFVIASGNTITGNVFTNSSPGLDALDTTGPTAATVLNTWTGNVCETSDPEGLCEGPTEGPLTITIDIKPGSDPNSINCNNGKGVIALAIQTTDDFDATTVDHTTVTLEGASETHVNKKTGEPRRHEEDVDGDSDTDLVLHFRLGDTDLTCDSIEGTLVGETFGGDAFTGTDAVRMIDRSG